MKKILIIISALGFLASTAEGQTLTDVLRYSLLNPSGSARFLGVGGSMGAMGADYGAISANPGGLGAYWTSEFVVTPSILSSTTNSVFANNQNLGRNVASLKMDNFGLIINRKPKNGLLKSFNIAIGSNRIADFNDEFEFRGYTNGTIAERFNERANGKAIDQLDLFEADLAYATGVVYAPDQNNNYITDFIPEDFTTKTQDVDESGGINELLFGIGANLGNKFLVGASIGVPILNFETTKTYKEFDEEDEIPAFNSLEFREYLNTSGLGYNFKAGIIAKITKNFSIGGSIHSPTYYSLTDNYYTQLTYNFTDNGSTQELEERSPDGSFRYRMATPWRTSGSLGFKKKVGKVAGFINGEVEWIDYRNGELDLSVNSNSVQDQILGEDINEQVESQLLSSINLKAGGELAYEKFRIRAGYNLLGSPYAADEGVFFPAFAFGLGWREDKYYIDLGWRRQEIREGYIPYQVLDDDRLQLVENRVRNTKLAITLGFQF